MLYIEQGCTGCDGPPTALERVYRDSNGALQRESLFSTPATSRYMTSTSVGADGTLYATACFGDCYEVGSGIDGAGYAILYVSKDDGRTWTAEPPAPRARKLWREGALRDGSVLLWGHPTQQELAYEIFPSGEQVTPPFADASPVVTGDPAEPILWQRWQGGGVFRPDGLRIPMPDVTSVQAPQVDGAQPMNGLTLSWWELDGTRIVQHFGIVQSGKLAAEFAGSDAVPSVRIGAWLDDHRALGNVNYSTPALFDFATGEVRLIAAGGRAPDDPLGPGRNLIVGFKTAP